MIRVEQSWAESQFVAIATSFEYEILVVIKSIEAAYQRVGIISGWNGILLLLWQLTNPLIWFL